MSEQFVTQNNLEMSLTFKQGRSKLFSKLSCSPPITSFLIFLCQKKKGSLYHQSSMLKFEHDTSTYFVYSKWCEYQLMILERWMDDSESSSSMQINIFIVCVKKAKQCKTTKLNQTKKLATKVV